MSALVTALCSDAGFAPRIRHEVEETSTLVTLVAAGLGVAVVPEPTAELALVGVCYRPLLPESNSIDLLEAYPTASATPLIANVLAVLHATSQP